MGGRGGVGGDGRCFGMIYLPLTIKGTSLVVAGLLALAANVAGQVGDLAESAIKRGAGVKDSGSLLPGHGGMLDRVDSTLFALPVLYSLRLLFFFGGRRCPTNRRTASCRPAA